MKLVVGLGNPGKKYRYTRHNIGFHVTELLAGHDLFGDKGSHVCMTMESGLIIARPQTYMNRSGIAVKELVQEQGIAIDEMLVVCDDFSISWGSIRLRRQGSSGGHKGLQSISDMLGSDAFARLRIGVGPIPQGEDPADYVLSKIDPREEEMFDRMVQRSVECIRYLSDNSFEKTMNKYNT